MRCSRCQFENIPGQDRCLRCGSILGAGGAAVEIHPPRMTRWKGPVRAMLRWLRLHRTLPEETVPRIPAFLRIMSGNALLGLILSIVPGLAHYCNGRFREVRWFVLGWLVVLLCGIFFFGSNIGLALLGAAVGLHGWVAFNHALSKEHADNQQNIIIDFVMLLIVIAAMYWGIRAIAFGDFVFGLSSMTIPYQQVQQGDTLLGRPSAARANLLPRGSMVIARFPQIYNYKVAANKQYETTGQIVALAGDKIEIIAGQFIVNGRALDREKFPVPEWMSGVQLAAIVPDNCYFVSTNYKMGGYGVVALTGGMVGNTCTLKKGDIEAIVVMRWFPLARRGILGNIE